jgi:protein phosphatase
MAAGIPLNQQSQESQEEALRNAFQKFDVNGDGHIQQEEFSKLMGSLGGFSSKEIRRLFKEADTDHSGGVDWKEFVKWICSGKAAKNMNGVGVESFSRLLVHEAKHEAAFVQQATVTKQVEMYLKEQNQEKSAEEEERALKRKQAKTQRMAQDAASNRVAVNDLGIGDDYDGYRLPLPCTTEGAQGLMKHYLMYGESKPLHPKYVSYLTSEFSNQYKARHPKPVVFVDTPKPGRLILVGDTHGQLADVLHILHQLGPPSAQNRYLFNGDIADRGHQAVEIFLILMAFFLADPECLIINRGNHENEDMNALDADSGGGFSEEVLSKYGLMAYRRFVSAFKALSLCVVVEKEIFVVHGGLARVKSLSLDYINSIDHHDCTAPHPLATGVKDQVFSDLLWSDPTDQPGKFKSERGIGIKFGPDLTTKFCMQNKLRFIVRSHQLPDDGRGFTKQHEGRCVTIFSASNYCGNGGNYGAVMVLASEHFPKYEIYEHYAAPLEELPRIMGVSYDGGKERLATDQEAAATARWLKEVEKMMIAIIEKKPDLYSHLVDLSKGNKLDLEEWEDMLTELVEPNLPWKEAAKHWNVVESSGMVDVGKFLSRWVVTLDSAEYSSFLIKAVKHVFEAILALDMDLEHTLLLFDVDGDGTVELKELRQVLGMFDLGLTTTQLDRLTGQIFTHCTSESEDGSTNHPMMASGSDKVKLNVQEFLKHLTVVYKQAQGCAADSEQQENSWAFEALDKIGRLIMKTPQDQLVADMEQAALKIQKLYRGRQTRKEVADGAAPKGKAKGKAKAAEKKNAGGGEEEEANDIAVVATNKMVALFQCMDVSGDGVLQIEEFVTGIEKLPGIDKIQLSTGGSLDHDTLIRMAKVIDVSGNGTINYLEFLQAFSADEAGSSDIAATLGEDITTVLFRHRHAIRMGCHYLDDEGCGKIRSKDFQTVLQGVNSALSSCEKSLTTTQISLLVEAMSSEAEKAEGGEAIVDYEIFLKSFVILDVQNNR